MKVWICLALILGVPTEGAVSNEGEANGSDRTFNIAKSGEPSPPSLPHQPSPAYQPSPASEPSPPPPPTEAQSQKRKRTIDES
ncbi:Hypothetical predicted protein [Olea europaea subsp. europaea]|uniref:Uncharacterized protein n=1 Tax=Olea europaea subsp. europaea TaxID=158383 RepID=A0A8S0QBC0_OLEEU|nr:Hypothetical predicted protein [Olea europaea subsp. europaea]